ncbi:PREDICTED: IgGFc-binding protein-like [Priapulus caudatus]|uniref:IgGFc-binding protein-like n=1 Tax=Priapulus caudatus TaxID=37621 RepID=A0ABM1E518_PRICU|nr:PREDICTED: IgGFc-binding protein-like [Priapulus caudatus]
MLPSGFRLYKPGNVLSVTLHRAQTIQVQASLWTEDLTGAKVESSDIVSVFSGTNRAAVLEGGRDHLIEQIPPVTAWGKEFLTVPLGGRMDGEIIRIIAAKHDTTVLVTSSTPEHSHNFTISAGEFIHLDSNESLYIVADRRALVCQYAKSQEASREPSDPMMMIVPPVEQYAHAYKFVAMGVTSTMQHYVTIIVRADDVAGLRVDSKSLKTPTEATETTTAATKETESMSWQVAWSSTPSAQFVAATLDVAVGTHDVRSVDAAATFAVLSYGYDKYESYGYPAGFRLTPIAAACKPTPPVDGDGVDNDCDGLVDEELQDDVDNDGDGLIDEDFDSARLVLFLENGVGKDGGR